MATQVMLQLGILVLALSMIFVMYNLRSQTTQARIRTRNKNRQSESNRHLAQASHHLARARSTSQSHQFQHAKNALDEADLALSIAPRDPHAHILRVHALHLMGHHSAALRSLHSALSLPAAKSLSAANRAEALVMSAELKIAVNRRRRVDSAVEDLVEAVRLSESDEEERSYTEAMCLLGKCYEWKGMKEEARIAFQKVLDEEPDSVEARSGLDRLGLS